MIGTIPEQLETEFGECLEARQRECGSFRHLGPHDMVQVSKSNKSKRYSTYFTISGVDVSSSASVAAYMNTLTFSIGETQSWFGKHPAWRITGGTYSSWNAFSMLDVRVNVNIPGMTEAYAIDARGERYALTDELWLETYASGMVRSLLLADGDANFVSCSRHEDPLPTKTEALLFFKAFGQLYGKGPALGATPQDYPPTRDRNNLVDAFFVAAKLTGMYEEAYNVLEKVKESNNFPECLPLMVRLDLLASNEVKGVKQLVEAVRANPRDAHSLTQEALFLLEKNSLDLALDCALRATWAAPGEFFSWHALARVYVAHGRFDQALLALNSSPILPSTNLDTVKFPQAKKVHTPLPTDGVLEEVWKPEAAQSSQQADSALLRLSAPNLKGSFVLAYQVLTDIYRKVGWSGLMETRGEVFLMEQEANAAATDPKPEGSNQAASSSIDEENTGHIAEPANAELADETIDSEAEQANANEAAAPESGKSANTKTKYSTRSKRLCQRRLDSLFMVLHEDISAYSSWQREAVHFETQQLPYNKSALEWEILGALALRLGYKQRALGALNKSLAQQFSHRAVASLLEVYAGPDDVITDVEETLGAAVTLMAWNHRWYREFSVKLRLIFQRLIALEGFTKIFNRVEANFGRSGVLKLVELELAKIKNFGVPGAEL